VSFFEDNSDDTDIPAVCSHCGIDVRLLVVESQQSPSHRVTHRNHSDSDKPESKSAPQPPPSPLTPASSEVRQPQAETVHGNPKPKPYDWRDAFTPPTWPNWALVAVGEGASIVGIRTLRGIIRQAEANETSALAAKASADALMNIERPWLLISYKKSEDAGAVFRVTNYGHTPSVIVEVGGTCITEDIEQLPAEPQYGKAAFFNYRPLAEKMESGNIWIPNEAVKRVGQFIAFGYVKYKDPFDREPHETRFCYRLSKNPLFENQPWGPLAYHRHT